MQRKMNSRNAVSSLSIQNKLSELKHEILPKIKYIESHGLLKAPFKDIAAMSTTCFGYKKPKAIEFTNSEIRGLEWVVPEQEAEEKLEFERVKHLDYWGYSKGLQKAKVETIVGRKNTTKQLLDIDPGLLTKVTDNYIIGMASQQLKSKKYIGLENSCVKFKSSSGEKKPLAFEAILRMGGKAKSVISQKSVEKTMSFDQELRMELQCLALKNELSEKKSNLRELLIENDQLLHRIKDLRTVPSSINYFRNSRN